ncbi:MAG: RecQ family ATP-dependent DNA helicase [Bacteroidota bacterium]
MNPLETLRQYWGYQSFRPLQQEIIQAVLEGKDVIALLPTGGGKSICFQVPTLMRPGLCVVISPLIALMKDQVDRLKKRGIAAEAVFTGMRASEIDLVLDNCIYGEVKFLYLSPERLKTTLLQERARKMRINLLAIDEAHCISQWGYDFRPAYLDIAAFKALAPNANIIALTATATPIVQKDIQEKLQLSAPIRFQESFIRNNLAYVVRKTEDKERQLQNILGHVPGTAIVYVNARKKANAIAQLLRNNNIKAVAYHAGLTTPERTSRQEAWINETTRVIVATNAFGMGIDKLNVRSVIHLDLPTSLEAYYQEAGRAGRDEKKAYAIVLYDDQDVAMLQKSIHLAYPSIEQLKKVYQHLANYYQVAVGSHDMATYDFDLACFASVYGLQPSLAYHALKTLERAGLVQLNETFSQPDQLHILTNPKALYAFQVAHARYDLLIKAVLRLYGGELFSAFCNISVQHIARLLNTTPQEVTEQLQALARLAIIQYYPQKDSPQLTFITPRYPAASLPLDRRKLKQRIAIAQKKVKAVMHYVTCQYRCRAHLLLEYLGEVVHQKCRQCDVCLKKEEDAFSNEDYTTYRSLVLQCLQRGIQELNQIVNKIDLAAERKILTTIRHMLENGELAYDSTYKLMSTPPPKKGLQKDSGKDALCT